MIISQISGRKILASFGDETVEATIIFTNGTKTRASVPAGISAGKYEIKKVSADQAVREIEEIGKICIGKDWTQATIDTEIASHNFGGNSTLAVSAAFYKASNTGFHPAMTVTKWPKIMLLLFEGGEHGNKNISIQEFMAMENSLEQAMRDFQTLKDYLQQNNIEATVGAEGGFSPEKFTNEDALNTIVQALPGCNIALDMAQCFGQSNIPEGFPIVSIEDPFDDESWDKWVEFTKNSNFMVVGDDLTVTNPERIKKAIDLKAINAVVIKPNQIGTITKAMEAVRVAREGGLKIIVSHRGEETDDTWIVDFALSVEADFVKFGGMDRGERIAKYNRLRELRMK